MKALVVVQARLASTRLVGKALKPLGGVPMLSFLLRRLLAGQLDTACCLATTTRQEDDALADIAQTLGVPVIRGECEDLLARYVRCLKHFPDRALVRVTADNPFTSLEMLRLALDGLADGAEYVSLPDGCPYGAGVDAFQAWTIQHLAAEAREAAEREHINLHIVRHPQRFTIFTPSIPEKWRRPSLRLTVDTPEDYTSAIRIVGDHTPEELLEFDAILDRTVCQTA